MCAHITKCGHASNCGYQRSQMSIFYGYTHFKWCIVCIGSVHISLPFEISLKVRHGCRHSNYCIQDE